MAEPIRDAGPGDAPALARIYNHYVEHSTATFEEEIVAERVFARRLEPVARAGLPWLVAERDGVIAGYAYGAPWRERSAYRFSAEVTVYVAPEATGGGLGQALYLALFERLRSLGLRTVIGVVTLPNPASVALHEKCGMAQVAQLRSVGYKHGRWLDVGYWQRLLDERGAG